MDAIARRWNVEELLRRRRADDVRRFVASQRSGRIDANPHQLDAVIFALARIPEGGCILADEVGLGKTIEAGLVIAQLLSEGAKRILLVTPKPLLGQWREELHNLFDMPVLEGGVRGDGFAGDGVFIVGREAAGGDDVAAALSAEPFDLVVIDEAHEVFAGLHRRYDGEGVYRPESKHAKIAGAVKEAIGDAPVLLLTATPIQNSLSELWGLVQYVDPEGTLLGDLTTFNQLFTDGERQLAVGIEEELRERMEQVLHRTLRRHAQEFMRRPFVGRSARTFEYRMSSQERALYDDVTRYLMSPGVAAFRGSHRTLLLLGFHRRMASSKAALAASLRNVETRLERMIRAAEAGRDEPGDETAHKFAEDFDDVDELEWEERDEGSPDTAKLRKELALVVSLRERAEGLSEDGKARALVDAVRARLDQDDASKVVVFTESLTTQQYIHDTLIDEGVVLPHEVTLFRGTNDSARALEALRRWEKDVGSRMQDRERPSRQVAIRLGLVHEFRTSSRVFVSTEAGAKGLNLQFADTLINYDLPWNPQRIEQRIGRCHRYGQTRDVTVINFLAKDNAAQRLTYEILSKKLVLFGAVLGASDVVLHEAQGTAVLPALGAHFEKEISEIYRQARSMDEIEERLRALRDSTDEHRQRFEDEHARTTRLIEHRLDASVQKTFRTLQQVLPDALRELDQDIERVVQAYLDAIDAPYERHELEGFVRFDLGSSSALPLSCQRTSFTIGNPRPDAEPVHLGHALIQAALAEARESSGSVTGLQVSGAGEGRFVLVKIRHHGLDTEERVHALAFERDGEELVKTDADAFRARIERSASLPSPAADAAITDAVEALLFEEQHRVGADQSTAFERRMRRLERFMEDRILVLRRDRSAVARRAIAAEHERDRAIGAQARSKAQAKLKRASERLEHLDERLAQLTARQDETYQRHRGHLLDRCFAPPSVEVLVDVPWIGSDGPTDP